MIVNSCLRDCHCDFRLMSSNVQGDWICLVFHALALLQGSHLAMTYLYRRIIPLSLRASLGRRGPDGSGDIQATIRKPTTLLFPILVGFCQLPHCPVIGDQTFSCSPGKTVILSLSLKQYPVTFGKKRFCFFRVAGFKKAFSQ